MYCFFILPPFSWYFGFFEWENESKEDTSFVIEVAVWFFIGEPSLVCAHSITNTNSFSIQLNLLLFAALWIIGCSLGTGKREGSLLIL